MSFAGERQAIESQLATVWGASAYSAVPVWYENVAFEVPASGPYLALSIISSPSNQIEIGGLGSPVLNRYAGYIQVDIAVPEETGTHVARLMADVLGNGFRRARLNTGGSGAIRCDVPELRNLGTSNGKHRHVLRVPYTRDKIE